jgi:hypothetical protein
MSGSEDDLDGLASFGVGGPSNLTLQFDDADAASPQQNQQLLLLRQQSATPSSQPVRSTCRTENNPCAPRHRVKPVDNSDEMQQLYQYAM